MAFSARAANTASVSNLTANARPADASSEPEFVVGPPSSWVWSETFDRQSLAAKVDSSSGQHWLLIEHQVNVPEDETYYHFIRQILTVSGVQNGSTLTADFNPGYESLTLHWVRVWRGGSRLDRLDTNKVNIVRQERDIDQGILDGKRSAVLVLDDVRVGDIVDFAYSVKGANPVFSERFSLNVDVQKEEPVERLMTRVRWPSQKHLYGKMHGCSVQAAVARTNGLVDYLWNLRQVPEIHLEDSLPAWCDPKPWVQLSDFRSWAEVNQWALDLFKNTSPLSPELAQKIAAWKNIPSREQQVLAALRFVQDDVRYFGIEIGASAEKPSNPSTVFSRRFGDCKDKSLLFVTILRGLGIEAWPVLVNTQLRHTLDDWQPAADAFDHCIAVVRFDGQTHWLDPTAGYQRGPLAAHYLPNYERGLVISPTTAALSIIPHNTGIPQTATTEHFRLGGKTDAASLRVTTVAEGRDADRIRAMFAIEKRSDIEKSYTHFYSELYPEIKMSSPIVMEDDEQQNRLQMTESYTIDKPWGQADKDGKYHCEFYPFAISSMFKKPVDTDRKLPLGINYPQHQILRTEVELTGVRPFNPESKTVSDPAFSYRKNAQWTGNEFILEYEYQSLADSVPANQSADYLQRLSEVSQSLGYTVSW